MISKLKFDAHFFSIFFIIVAFVSFTFSILGYKLLFQIFQIFSWVLLLFVYLVSTSQSKRDVIYMLMLVSVGLGNCFFRDMDTYLTNFNYEFYPLTFAQALFVIVNYKNSEPKPSFKDIFIFSLPFIFLIIIVFSFVGELTLPWFLKGVLIASLLCVNSSLVTINYVYKSSIKNYLLFIGLFIWFLSDYFGVLLFFVSNKANEEIFFLLILLLNWMAHFMICRGILEKKDYV